jgi:hypothetical protein
LEAVVGGLALWRYPVKAMLGELLDAVEIGPAHVRAIAAAFATVAVDEFDELERFCEPAPLSSAWSRRSASCNPEAR